MTDISTGNKRKALRRRLLPYLASILALLAAGAVRDADAAQNNRETPIVKAVRRVGPAVVNISSRVEMVRRESPFAGLRGSPGFEWFFRDFFDRGWERRVQRTSLGSGVIIDGRRGYILTNAHVVSRAGEITVTLQDERTFGAQLVGSDPDSDLAVLKIDSDKELPSVPMGDCEDLMIGETVIAIGNPFGFSHTVTTGVVSAVKRSFRADDREYHDFIQIDASINPGNSGGPLLNINGELIGVNTAIYARAQGIGFAIPIDRARRIVDDLIRYGEVVLAWIGLRVQTLDERLADYLDPKEAGGVVVRAVEKGSPAERAGVRPGDVLLAMGAQRIADRDDYAHAARAVAPGQTVDLKVWRDGRSRRLPLTAAEFPAARSAALAAELFGVTVEDISPANRRRYRLSLRAGVVITAVDPRSHLARVGVEPGDVIRQVGDAVVENRADYEKAAVQQRHRDSVVLLVQRGRQGYYITVEL